MTSASLSSSEELAASVSLSVGGGTKGEKKFVKGAIARVPRTRSVICNYLNTSSYYSNWK